MCGIRSLGRRVVENYRLILAVTGVLYAGFAFLFRLQEIYPRLDKIEARMEGFVIEHNEMRNKLRDNEQQFNLTAMKLDTTLTRISADLQYIKQKLIDKGLK